MNEVEPIVEGVTLSITALATEFMVSTDTVKRRLAKRGVNPVGHKGKWPIYRLRDCIPALTDAYDSEIDPKDLEPSARKQWFESELRRLEVEEKKGNLIKEDEHRKVLLHVIKVTLEAIDTLSDRLESTSGITPEIKMQIDQQINPVKLEWSGKLLELDDVSQSPEDS